MPLKYKEPSNTACSVPPTGGSLRVFKQFSGLRLDAVSPLDSGTDIKQRVAVES
jgi:hypothetical protein